MRIAQCDELECRLELIIVQAIAPPSAPPSDGMFRTAVWKAFAASRLRRSVMVFQTSDERGSPRRSADTAGARARPSDSVAQLHSPPAATASSAPSVPERPPGALPSAACENRSPRQNSPAAHWHPQTHRIIRRHASPRTLSGSRWYGQTGFVRRARDCQPSGDHPPFSNDHQILGSAPRYRTRLLPPVRGSCIQGPTGLSTGGAPACPEERTRSLRFSEHQRATAAFDAAGYIDRLGLLDFGRSPPLWFGRPTVALGPRHEKRFQ